MPVRQIDFPDSFYGKMVADKQTSGKTVRRQVLEALCAYWGWSHDMLPFDRRMSFEYRRPEEVVLPQTPWDNARDAKEDDGWDVPPDKPENKEEF